jgi:hypothetical protein
MASDPMSAYRAPEAEILRHDSVVSSVKLTEPTTLDANTDDGCGASRGFLFGLLLCAPVWVGIYRMVF